MNFPHNSTWNPRWRQWMTMIWNNLKTEMTRRWMMIPATTDILKWINQKKCKIGKYVQRTLSLCTIMLHGGWSTDFLVFSRNLGQNCSSQGCHYTSIKKRHTHTGEAAPRSVMLPHSPAWVSGPKIHTISPWMCMLPTLVCWLQFFTLFTKPFPWQAPSHSCCSYITFYSQTHKCTHFSP